MTKTLLKDIKKQRGLDILDQTIEQLFSNDSAGYISAYMYYVMNMRGMKKNQIQVLFISSRIS